MKTSPFLIYFGGGKQQQDRERARDVDQARGEEAALSGFKVRS